MATYDVYGALDQLKKFLEQDKQVDLTKQITEAVETGSTSSEIFIRVHYLLSQFKASGAQMSTATNKLLTDLIQYLERTLNY